MSTTASEQTALFALGNFWEPEYEFSKMHGVIETEAGYTGGTSANPTYHDIGDHSEAVRVDFDPHAITYEDLLEKFWKLHEPTAEYETKFRSAIFYFDETQRELAEASKAHEQQKYEEPITTAIIPAGKFYSAEQYNQQYLRKLRGEI